VYSGGDAYAAGDTANDPFPQLNAFDAAFMGEPRLVLGVHKAHCIRRKEGNEMIALGMAALLALIGFLCATDGIATMGLNPRPARRDEKSVKQATGK
jgi:hypothetical protein